MNFKEKSKQWENQELAKYLDSLDRTFREEEEAEKLQSDYIDFDTWEGKNES